MEFMAVCNISCILQEAIDYNVIIWLEITPYEFC
jgi:hypothetical protein